MIRWLLGFVTLRLDFSSPKVQAPPPQATVTPVAPAVDPQAEETRQRAAAEATRKASAGGRESTIHAGRDIALEEQKKRITRGAAQDLLG